MTIHDMPKTGLIYNGTEVRAVGERLNLTDMWKAAGADPSRKPADWARKEGASFIEAVSLSLNMPVEHIYRAERGKSGSTQAHWQIGLAYAKYLSPEFHMWCNTVVRERMEGKSVSLSDADEITRRIDGMLKMVAHKVTGTEKVIALMADTMERQDSVIAGLTERVNNLMLLADSRGRATADRVSVRQLLDDAGALPKGRRSLNRRVGNALRNIALTSIPPVPLRRCIHSGVWLYPVDFAQAFMRAAGSAWVAEHNDKVMGQGVIRFPRRRKGHALNATPSTTAGE